MIWAAFKAGSLFQSYLHPRLFSLSNYGVRPNAGRVGRSHCLQTGA